MTEEQNFMETSRKGAGAAIALLLVFLVAGVLAGCGAQNRKTEKKPELVIGITMYEPYVYKDVKGDYAGIDVEKNVYGGRNHGEID